MEPEGWRNGDRAAEKAQRASAKTFQARKPPLWHPPELAEVDERGAPPAHSILS